MAPRSIQGAQELTPTEISARCRLFKHSFDDGSVHQERLPDTRKMAWVARLQCSRCNTRRVDVMVPQTCELIARHYEYSSAKGYDRSMTHEAAKKFLFRRLLRASTVEPTA